MESNGFIVDTVRWNWNLWNLEGSCSPITHERTVPMAKTTHNHSHNTLLFSVTKTQWQCDPFHYAQVCESHKFGRRPMAKNRLQAALRGAFKRPTAMRRTFKPHTKLVLTYQLRKDERLSGLSECVWITLRSNSTAGTRTCGLSIQNRRANHSNAVLAFWHFSSLAPAWLRGLKRSLSEGPSPQRPTNCCNRALDQVWHHD